MFSKKLRLNNHPEREKISVATALVLLAIDELIFEKEFSNVYGYQIMTHLQENFNWDVKSGTVYPILKKLQEDKYIKSETILKKGSKRHQIFYTLTKRGAKLIEIIKKLDSRKLDAVVSPEKEENNTKFDDENFTDEYVAPFLLDLDTKISNIISHSSLKKDSNNLDIIKAEIIKTIEQFNLYISLLENEIHKIDKIKKLKMDKN